MPTIIYDRDNPQGRRVEAPATSGVIIYERDNNGVVQTYEDGVKVSAVVAPLEPAPEKAESVIYDRASPGGRRLAKK